MTSPNMHRSPRTRKEPEPGKSANKKAPNILQSVRGWTPAIGRSPHDQRLFFLQHPELPKSPVNERNFALCHRELDLTVPVSLSIQRIDARLYFLSKFNDFIGDLDGLDAGNSRYLARVIASHRSAPGAINIKYTLKQVDAQGERAEGNKKAPGNRTARAFAGSIIETTPPLLILHRQVSLPANHLTS